MLSDIVTSKRMNLFYLTKQMTGSIIILSNHHSLYRPDHEAPRLKVCTSKAILVLQI